MHFLVETTVMSKKSRDQIRTGLFLVVTTVVPI